MKDTSRLKEKHLEAQKDSFINHTVNALVGKKERDSLKKENRCYRHKSKAMEFIL